MRNVYVWFVIMTFAVACRAATASFTVAADGSGDFKTVQEAIAAAPEKSVARFVIQVRPGTYAGRVVVPKSKGNIALIGDDAATTILTWDRNVKDPIPKGN